MVKFLCPECQAMLGVLGTLHMNQDDSLKCEACGSSGILFSVFSPEFSEAVRKFNNLMLQV